MSGYNGWTNYETWAWKLWIDNDQGSYEYWLEQTETILEDAEASKYMTKEEEAVCTLAGILEENCEEMYEDAMPDQPGPFHDLLRSAIGAIEWREIARSLIEEAKEA